MKHFIAPVDGSAESWRAVGVALSLARTCRGRVDVVEIVFHERDALEAEQRLAARLSEMDRGDVDVTIAAQLAVDGVASTISDLALREPGTTVVMGSQGRGRSAALVGSVAEELLRLIDRPTVIVGPEAESTGFDGPVVVTVDGSEMSEAALPVAAAWSMELGARPCIVEVAAPAGPQPSDAEAVAYVARLAQRLSALSGQRAQHEVLYDQAVDLAVAVHAKAIGASLIIATTHGRTGMPRFVVGSTVAGFVRHAPCPLLLVRPPHAASTERLPRSGH